MKLSTLRIFRPASVRRQQGFDVRTGIFAYPTFHRAVEDALADLGKA